MKYLPCDEYIKPKKKNYDLFANTEIYNFYINPNKTISYMKQNIISIT